MPGRPDDHPKRLAMKAIIESPAGRDAIEKAAKQGLPAICGVDPLLKGLIIGYGTDADDTDDISFAGATVATLLKGLGYSRVKDGVKCGPECVAKTGTV